MNRKEAMKLGNVYRCPHTGTVGMVVWLGRVGHEATPAAEVRWRDGKKDLMHRESLREEYEFLGLPAVTFRKRRPDGGVNITLTAGDEGLMFYSGEEPSSLSALRVAAWEGQYSPPAPTPESADPAPAQEPRSYRIAAARAARSAWLASESGQLFLRTLGRLEEDLRRAGDLTPDADGLTARPVLEEFKRHCRAMGGWRPFESFLRS